MTPLRGGGNVAEGRAPAGGGRARPWSAHPSAAHFEDLSPGVEGIDPGLDGVAELRRRRHLAGQERRRCLSPDFIKNTLADPGQLVKVHTRMAPLGPCTHRDRDGKSAVRPLCVCSPAQKALARWNVVAGDRFSESDRAAAEARAAEDARRARKRARASARVVGGVMQLRTGTVADGLDRGAHGVVLHVDTSSDEEESAGEGEQQEEEEAQQASSPTDEQRRASWAPAAANLAARFPSAGDDAVWAQLRACDGHAGRAAKALQAAGHELQRLAAEEAGADDEHGGGGDDDAPKDGGAAADDGVQPPADGGEGEGAPSPTTTAALAPSSALAQQHPQPQQQQHAVAPGRGKDTHLPGWDGVFLEQPTRPLLLKKRQPRKGETRLPSDAERYAAGRRRLDALAAKLKRMRELYGRRCVPGERCLMCRQHWPGICRLVGKNAKKTSAKARAKQEREMLDKAATCKFGLHRFPTPCFTSCRVCGTHALGLMDDHGLHQGIDDDGGGGDEK